MAKRDDILSATLELISEIGLQSTTFSKIFKRANVGAGTFYHYFENKEALVGELYLRTVDHFSASVLQGYDASGSVPACFRTIMANMAEYARAYPKELWFLENYAHSPFISDEIRNREIPLICESFALVKRGQEQRLIRNMHPMLCVELITGMLTSAVQGALLGKYPFAGKELDQVIDACWRAVSV